MSTFPTYDRVRFTLATPAKESPGYLLDLLRNYARSALELEAPSKDAFTSLSYAEALSENAELTYAEWTERDTDCDGTQTYQMHGLHLDLYLERSLAIKVVRGMYALAERTSIHPVEEISRQSRDARTGRWSTELGDVA